MSIEISPSTSAQGQARPWWYAEAATAAVLGVASLLAGLLVGLVWRAVAPDVTGQVSISGGQKSAFLVNPETKGFVGQDGTFALCAAVAGALLAIAAFSWFRSRGPLGAALALAGAGIGAAYFAAWFGGWLGPGHGSIFSAARNVPNNGTFDLPLQLGATGVVWLWPAVAVGLYFLLTLVFGPTDPEPGEERHEFPQWADPVDLTMPGPEDSHR
jgi:hypothetical protein